MLGRISIQGTGWKVTADREQIEGVPVCHMLLPADRAKYWKRAAALCRRYGVRRVLLPQGRACAPAMCRYGVERVTPQPLYRAMAAPLAMAALRRLEIPRSRACVLLRGERGEQALTAAALALTPEVRQVVLDFPGCEDLRRYLWQEYGMAQWEPQAGADCPVELCFSGNMCCTGELALYLGREESRLCGGRILPPEELVVPAQCDIPALLCALWQKGALRLKRLRADFP